MEEKIKRYDYLFAVIFVVAFVFLIWQIRSAIEAKGTYYNLLFTTGILVVFLIYSWLKEDHWLRLGKFLQILICLVISGIYYYIYNFTQNPTGISPNFDLEISIFLVVFYTVLIYILFKGGNALIALIKHYALKR